MTVYKVKLVGFNFIQLVTDKLKLSHDHLKFEISVESKPINPRSRTGSSSFRTGCPWEAGEVLYERSLPCDVARKICNKKHQLAQINCCSIASPASKAAGGNKIIHTVVQRVIPGNCQATFSQQSHLLKSFSLDFTYLPNFAFLGYCDACSIVYVAINFYLLKRSTYKINNKSSQLV